MNTDADDKDGSGTRVRHLREERREITLDTDVFVLPGNTNPRQRLSLSFALAQSAVLSVFEARIQKRVEDYKYIPETFASNGKMSLTQKQLGNMVGDVFVMRHDVNLHTVRVILAMFRWLHAIA